MRWPGFLTPLAVAGWITRHWANLALTVVGLNVLFTGADVYFAHHLDRPETSAQWVPVYFSAVGGLFLVVLGLMKNLEALGRIVHQTWLWLSIAVGVVGLFFHLTMDVGDQDLLKSFVYSAPIAAPLVYAGVSLFGLIVLEPAHRFTKIRRSQVLMLIVSGGFAGNTILSILDHERDHFFNAMEWAPVVASLFATFHCFLLALRSEWSDTDRGYLFGTLWMQFFVAGVGFYLHARAGLALPAGEGVHRFFYNAPIFAPLLLANVAVYGMLTLLAPRETSA